MLKQYTEEQLGQVYEKLPEELKEAIFAVDTAENIGTVGETYGITDERLNEIARYAGYVLMGLLLPQEFPGVLEQELKLPKVLAEAIGKNINRLVFYPVRPSLERLHRMEIEVSARVVTPEPSAGEGEASAEKPRQEPKGPDSYREPIE